jgi:hypothetical protein
MSGGADAATGLAEVLAGVRTESGAALLELTEASPVLLIFLRHFGCTFCRKTISDVADVAPKLEALGVRPVFVHMGTSAIAKAHFDHYGLSEVERVNDPDKALYGMPMFALERKNWLAQGFQPAVWAGWLKGAIFQHGIGMVRGDGDQMPGIFFLKGGEIARRFRYRTIADEPDYLRLVE